MFRSIKMVLLLLLTSFTLSWAAIPAPPVNQNIGIPDSVFNNLKKLNCAYCHKPDTLTPEERAELGWTFTPPTVKDGVVADRHHLRVINEIIMGPNTQAPNGVPGEKYVCLSCHIMEWDQASGTNKIVPNFKDCLNCHKQVTNATVHHLTEKAQALDCKHCHGARIDNPNDGHYILSSKPSMITPRPSNGKGPNGQGACTYCHNEGIDPVSGISVKTNAQNHHGTGIGQEGVSDIDCTLCHKGAGTDYAIRQCTNCHGVKSIHGIQADSNGDGIITVAGESPYYGHVGSDPQDCKGCHNNFAQNALSTSPSNNMAPQINDLSTFRISNATDITITISGLALTNEFKTPNGIKEVKPSTITLTDINDKVTSLTPYGINESSLKVKIPKGLTPGSYYLRAKKVLGNDIKESNPMNIVILPAIWIESVTSNGNKLTVKGSGFGKYMNAVDSGVYLTVADTRCSVESWTDKKIVATCNKTCGSVKVKSIFASTSKIIDCGGVGIGDYETGFAQGNSDACSWKTWSIPDAYLGNDVYVKAYDEGWESCDRGNPPGNDGDKEKGFKQGKSDACSFKTWSIPDAYLGNTTYVNAYDEGWESCDRGNPPADNADRDAGFAQGKADSCAWKTWSIPSAYQGNDTYVKAYDEGWESCR